MAAWRYLYPSPSGPYMPAIGFEVKGRGGGLTGMEKVNYILASGEIISAMVPVLTFLTSQSGKKMSIQSSG